MWVRTGNGDLDAHVRGARAGTLDREETATPSPGRLSAAAAPDVMEITDDTVDG
jgi:hypothetical protein